MRVISSLVDRNKASLANVWVKIHSFKAKENHVSDLLTVTPLFLCRQSKEREALQKRHQKEIEDLMKEKGYTIPASPLMSTASGNLSTAPILSPLNISNIPNPPPLPASLMSMQMRESFPIFSVAQRRPDSKGNVSSFNEELSIYVQNFTARNKHNINVSETKSDIASHKSDTATTETTERSSSPRVVYTTVNSVSASTANNSDTQFSVAQSTGQSASLHDGMMQSPPLFMPNQMYNLPFPGSPFVPISGSYASPQMVEAGLLPMANSYPTVVPVTTNVLTDSLSEPAALSSVSVTKPQL